MILPPPCSFADVLKGDCAQPPSPRTQKKSFTNILTGNGDFPVRPVSVFKGEPTIFFSKEHIETLAAPFKYALVGKFAFKSRPPMGVIRKFFVGLGLKKLVTVGLLHDSFILVHVDSEEDYSRLLLRAAWYVEGVKMNLFKWTPSFVPFEDSPVVPVWIGLPGLPLHFFNRSALFSIANALGNPLKSDEPTAKLTRPSVARVCVELDVSKVIPSRIWLGDEKVGYWQEVCVENPPTFCSHCKILGHEDVGCFKLHPSLLEKKKEAELKAAELKAEELKRSDKGKEKGIIYRKVHKPHISEPVNQNLQSSLPTNPTTPSTAPSTIFLTPFNQQPRARQNKPINARKNPTLSPSSQQINRKQQELASQTVNPSSSSKEDCSSSSRTTDVLFDVPLIGIRKREGILLLHLNQLLEL